MRRGIVLLIICWLTCLMLAGCFVRHHGYDPAPPRRDCRSVCARWGHKDHCTRSCRVRNNGVCMVWERRCSPQRTCLRYETRCR